MAGERQLRPEQRAPWTPQTVANRRRCAGCGATPMIGERGALLQTGPEASDAETADLSA